MHRRCLIKVLNELKVELEKELMVNLAVSKGKKILTMIMMMMKKMNLSEDALIEIDQNLLIFSWIGRAKDMELSPFFCLKKKVRNGAN